MLVYLLVVKEQHTYVMHLFTCSASCYVTCNVCMFNHVRLVVLRGVLEDILFWLFVCFLRFVYEVLCYVLYDGALFRIVLAYCTYVMCF